MNQTCWHSAVIASAAVAAAAAVADVYTTCDTSWVQVPAAAGAIPVELLHHESDVGLM
jgi:hypothetical protein